MMKRIPIRALATLAALITAAASPAHSQTFRMTMQGILDSRSSIVSNVATPLADNSPFTLTAIFSRSTSNLVAPIGIAGFVAYTPSSMMLTLGGINYTVVPYTFATPTGLSVAVFDSTTPFGVPNRYGVGVIQNPLADGAGIVADFIGASPSFVLGATGVVPTTFTGFAGVGVSSGVCSVGTPASCQAHAGDANSIDVRQSVVLARAWQLRCGRHTQLYVLRQHQRCTGARFGLAFVRRLGGRCRGGAQAYKGPRQIGAQGLTQREGRQAAGLV